MAATLLQGLTVGMYGGMARALFGLGKMMLAERKIKWAAFAIVLPLSAAMGAFAGAALKDFSSAIQLLAGYAAFDLLDGIHTLFGFAKIRIPLQEKEEK